MPAFRPNSSETEKISLERSGRSQGVLLVMEAGHPVGSAQNLCSFLFQSTCHSDMSHVIVTYSDLLKYLNTFFLRIILHLE